MCSDVKLIKVGFTAFAYFLFVCLFPGIEAAGCYWCCTLRQGLIENKAGTWYPGLRSQAMQLLSVQRM